MCTHRVVVNEVSGWSQTQNDSHSSATAHHSGQGVKLDRFRVDDFGAGNVVRSNGQKNVSCAVVDEQPETTGQSQNASDDVRSLRLIHTSKLMRSKLTLSAFYLFAAVLDGEFQQTRTEETGNVHHERDQRQHLVESVGGDSVLA